MIAACPKCSARYRVDPEKLGAGARLRCTKCEAVFRVQAPKADPVVAVPQAPEPDVVAAAHSPQAPAAPAPETPQDGARSVLVADPDIENGKRTAAAIASWGLNPLLVHDGVEAILAIQRNLPAVAVIDAALPKMFGFQICEMVKRNESLRSTKIVLIGAIHHADRYRRPPSELYGADSYLEQPDLPNGLASVLEGFGLTTQASAPSEPLVPSPPPTPTPMTVPPSPAVSPVVATTPPVTAPTPQEQPVADDPNAEECAKAERLARIIVSDIVLYHPEKFEAAVRAGNVAQALESDLAEGRTLFVQRIGQSVRDERDFLMDELQRVAAERSK